MKTFFKKLYYIKNVTDIEEIRLIRTSISLLFFLGIFNLILAGILPFYRELTRSFLFVVLIGPIFFAFIPLVKKPKSSRISLNIILFLSLVLIVYRSFETGGLVGGPTYWLAILPLVAGNLLGAKGAFTWMTFAILACLIIYFGPLIGIKVVGKSTIDINIFVIIATILTSGISIYSMENSRKKYHDQLAAQEKYFNEKKRFELVGKLANKISHEINNPLTILSCIENRLENLDHTSNKNNEELKNILKIFIHSKKRIQRVVQTFQSLNNVLYNQHERKVLLKDLLNSTLKLYNDTFKEHKIDYSVYSQPSFQHIEVNPFLSEILITMLDNSIEGLRKVKQETKTIELTVDLNYCEKKIYILLSDNGSGIDEKERNKIFDLFYSSKLQEGIGSGLAISMYLIKEMKGELKLLSSNTGDTTFKITIPYTS